jgi:phosphoglycolate/pyridoxal phosphate phosphatase family enzyme
VTDRRIRALLLDLDGVVYLGPRLLPGVASTIRKLEEMGVHPFYVTNNATRTRSAFAAHLRRLGLPCREDDVMNTARAAAILLKGRYGKGARIVVVGEHGLPHELAATGLTPVTTATRARWERSRRRCSRASAVVVSFDRTLTYWKLCAALDALRGGADLVACNLDPTWPDHRGILPSTGSLVRLLEYASGKKAELVGKPDPAMFRMLLTSHGIRPAQALVVGDRIDVDVAAGLRLGSRTALVLTGMATRRDLAHSRIRPDFVARSFTDLLKFVHPLGSVKKGSERARRRPGKR